MKIQASLLAAATLAWASPTPALVPLDKWWSATALTIFPNTTGWEPAFDALFSPDVKVTFNFAEHDFEGLKTFFRGVESTVTANYEYLRITPVDQVVLPDENGEGGIVVMTGNEEGQLKGSDVVRVERDAVFAVINSARQVVEWREFTNFF